MRDTIAELALSAYSFLLPVAEVAFLLALVVLLPMAIVRKTRGVASIGLVIVSYVVGATAWFLGAGITFASFGWVGLFFGLLLFGVGVVFGAGITFASFGWVGLFFGLLLFGVGVVFLGIVGAFLTFDEPSLALSLVVMSIVTFGARLGGAWLSGQEPPP